LETSVASNFEEEFVSYSLIIELKCSGLTKGSTKRIAFELAIKTFLPVHCQYNKEEKLGSGCLT
jgi:hypothetical protein